MEHDKSLDLDLDLDYHQRRRERRVYEEILQSYDDLRIRTEGGLNLKEARSRILRYYSCVA